MLATRARHNMRWSLKRWLLPEKFLELRAAVIGVTKGYWYLESARAVGLIVSCMNRQLEVQHGFWEGPCEEFMLGKLRQCSTAQPWASPNHSCVCAADRSRTELTSVLLVQLFCQTGFSQLLADLFCLALNDTGNLFQSPGSFLFTGSFCLHLQPDFVKLSW